MDHHLVPKPVNVDSSVFGVVPLELYRQTQDPRYLAMGRAFADAPWEQPAEPRKLKPEELAALAGGFTWQTRYWIDDMYMVTMLQVEAWRATGEHRYVDRATWEMAAYLDRLQQEFDDAALLAGVSGQEADLRKMYHYFANRQLQRI